MMMKSKKKDPKICEVCDMSQSDQQTQECIECIQSIILEQQKPMHDSHLLEDNVEKGVQSVDIIGDTTQNPPEQIQADPDVFITNACLIFMEQNILMDNLSFSQNRKM